MRIRSWLAGCLLTLAFFTSRGLSAPAHRTLRPLTELAARRVQLAAQVAAAKFGTPAPIDVPEREQRILDTVAAQAPALGLAPAAAVRFFRDQFEASKIVQRDLLARWNADPAQAPRTRPDLTTVRPRIDRLDQSLLAELAATRATRAGRTCSLRRALALRHATRNLDPLQTRALTTALRSTCT